MGVELNAGWDVSSWLTLEGNAALSRDKIKNFDEMVEDWDDWEGNTDAAKWHCDGNADGYRQIHHSRSTLAFFAQRYSQRLREPALPRLAGCLAHGLREPPVSGQHRERTAFRLPCYATSDLNMTYTAKVTKAAV
jgi:iron complex outermembrane receptor protein